MTKRTPIPTKSARPIKKSTSKIAQPSPISLTAQRREELFLRWFTSGRDTGAVCRDFGIEEASFHRWAKQGNWTKRVEEMDIKANQELIEELISEALLPTIEELQLSEGLMSKAVQGIAELDATQLKPQELIALFQEGERIEEVCDKVIPILPTIPHST